MDSECEDPASSSERALRRQISEVGAVCSNPARTDLCGGRRATGVPTATKGFLTTPLQSWLRKYSHGSESTSRFQSSCRAARVSKRCSKCIFLVGSAEVVRVQHCI